MSKKCFKCNEIKPISHYYKHSQMADGHLNKCKECTKADTLNNRNDNLEYYQEYDRKRANLPKRRRLRKEIAKRWRADPELRKRTCELKKAWSDKNVLKRAAHIWTCNAIRDGRIIKKPCEVCGKKKVDAHHDDYNFPTSVRFLCRKHHSEHHKLEREKNRNAQH